MPKYVALRLPDQLIWNFVYGCFGMVVSSRQSVCGHSVTPWEWDAECLLLSNTCIRQFWAWLWCFILPRAVGGGLGGLERRLWRWDLGLGTSTGSGPVRSSSSSCHRSSFRSTGKSDVGALCTGSRCEKEIRIGFLHGPYASHRVCRGSNLPCSYQLNPIPAQFPPVGQVMSTVE